ncbi:dynein intermediate chain 2, ciliary [Teleopsis dalmanni]|uniref:dynein intermediate chain 2, ciliary n=1 Tax=Teleopsis dalmanni TaxID=139649 RepID=UPI0018CD9D6F|nr:dynein intermediate chain 2, ciliary [Teleopsis dalmanni]
MASVTSASELNSILDDNDNNDKEHSDNNDDIPTGSKGKDTDGTDGGQAAGGESGDMDIWMKSRQMIRPENQLDLTDAELSEEITKVLTTTNLNIPTNVVVYDFKERTFLPMPTPSNIVTLINFDGTALHTESEEARLQIEESGEMGCPLPEPKHGDNDESSDDKLDKRRKTLNGDGEAEDGEAADKEDGEDEEGDGEKEAEDGGEGEAEDGAEGEEGQEQAPEETEPAEVQAAQLQESKKKLINQFNYCERGALTHNNSTRTIETETIPPPRSQFGATVQQWVIYDSYLEDYAQNKELREEKKSTAPKDPSKSQKHQYSEAEELNQKYLKSWQILERMINQNLYADVAADYRFYEDPADEFREEGTLLPLWKFVYERTKKLSVTEVMFSPKYYDLFAVCYGSYDFMKQPNEGALCLFTVKNPSYPDYIIMTEGGVMCCDIHPQYPFLLVVGLYDGNVGVYNIKNTNYKEPLYKSKGVNNKHNGVVWQVKWGPDMTDGEINFYSLSSDGRVFNWILMHNKLALTTIITLNLENGNMEGPDGTAVRLLSCGACLLFHPNDPEIFLVGSEEGQIYKCSIAYNSKYLMSYTAHNLPVYRIDFNRFNCNIFVSCSADWRIKIWEDKHPDPLFVFDLGGAIGDVKWAPYSSTVFAAVTADGKVFVFDLNVNKYKAICEQLVVPRRKNKLTRLAFNEKLPFIIVGDDKGTVTSLKLSPNLRLMVKPPKKQMNLSQNILQIQKLEKILSLVRELPEGEIIKDTTTTVQS